MSSGIDPAEWLELVDPDELDPEARLEQARALELLASLATALFPEGAPEKDRLTWSDTSQAAVEPHDAHERALARLEAAERRFKSLVEQIPAVTFLAVLGEGGNEVYVSPHVEQLLGYTQEEWLADPFMWYWRLHPDDRQLWNDEFARGCRTGGPFKAECRFIARDGRVVWVHGEARVLRDPLGRPQYLQGIAFDITESKNAQQMMLDLAVKDARLEEEKAIAHRVQTSLLPSEMHVVGLELSAVMEPADEVGGDYYDVQPFEGGAWLAIGDVSGHGLDAGLVMLMLQSAFSALVRARQGAMPAEILILLNSVIFQNVADRLGDQHYVTLCLLRYRRDGRVDFAGAHEHILVRRAATGRVEQIATPGVWIGLRADIGRPSMTRQGHLQLEDGDVLVLFTDGLIESTNERGEQFDMHRLTAAIESAPDLAPSVLRDHVLYAFKSYATRIADDVSLFVGRYRKG